MTDIRYEYDVAIAGGGPVGVTLAALLGQSGLSVFIADSEKDVYPLPRAAHFDHEVMRIFQQLGIAAKITDSIVAGTRYVFQNQAGEALLDFDLTKPTESGWGSYMMHQPGIERALRERLKHDRLVDFHTGLRFESFQQTETSVLSRWQAAGQARREHEVRSRFLVGCDGAWSSVRTGMGVGLDDLVFDEPWLVLDLLVEAENGLPTHSIQYCDPHRPTTYVVMGNRRRRFEFMLKPDEQPDAMLADDRIQTLLEPWDTKGLIAVERKAVYRFHALVADRWRSGDVLIAGDAAHQMPPFAGQGMCSGIRDAAALSWRLFLAKQSLDAGHLLDSYQFERDPHVRLITHAAVETGRVVCTLDPQMAAMRDAQMLASRAAGDPMPDIGSPPLAISFGLGDTVGAGTRFSQPSATVEGKTVRMDDVLGTRAWLIARNEPDLPQSEVAGIYAVALSDRLLAPFRGAIEEWLSAASADSVLVRADRYVFGTGNASALVEAYVEQAGLARIAVPLVESQVQ